ncbi:Aste57867_19914 [Aphanomyces stellatus]|uniref:Alkyl transferase n=1 Tax=Aphanomyces stellatus TaxID=120398 RepID=A0A485LDR6_9STRA|nr:hypothetical protein As57867_019848 [Aphanomyces stellatus]VFT96612.1 Aste57867_19914 [Aphanomyces stellatus]
MELETLYIPYSHTGPSMYSGLQSSYSSYNSLYNAFEVYWLCVLPLLVLGIPICLIPMELALRFFLTPSLAASPAPSATALNPAWIIPKHMAVVMDGNRRHGRMKYGIPVKGHHEGSQRLVDFLKWCMHAGVDILTVYAFSTENWNREAAEVDALMGIFDSFMKDIIPEALARDIRVCVLVSDGTRLPAHVKDSIRAIEASTAHCTSFTLNICASYGSRNEIVGACQRIATQVAAGTLAVEDISDDVFSRHLLTRGVPDPDVLVRTSGELRLSNFLMFQIAYSELIFLDKMWPALTHDDFVGILDEFNRRKRRFGK